MLVEKIQQQLESLYAVDCHYRVSDFMIEDATLAEQIDTSENARLLPEKLLILQQDDAVDVALYLDPKLIEHLTVNDPLQKLHDGNIHAFWQMVEGVSHFVYFTWNAHHDRAVSMLEMELQAEVDKFILAVQLLRQQLENFQISSLHYGLFHRVRFDSRLNDEEKARYQDANYFAAKFCNYLSRQLSKAQRNRPVLPVLRQFYRLTHHNKLQSIDRLCYQ